MGEAFITFFEVLQNGVKKIAYCSFSSFKCYMRSYGRTGDLVCFLWQLTLLASWFTSLYFTLLQTLLQPPIFVVFVYAQIRFFILRIWILLFARYKPVSCMKKGDIIYRNHFQEVRTLILVSREQSPPVRFKV